METVNVFQDKFEAILQAEVKSILLENTEETSENASETPWESQNSNSMSCSLCRVDFPDVTTQREHFKLDWHRFNLKQSLKGKGSITEQEFDVKNGNDDISSISGSDSEKEDTLDSYATAQGKIFLQSGNREIFSLYKCLIFNKKDEIDETLLMKRLKDCCAVNKQWTIFMLGGGHFAGAIFKGTEPILHKTFHCYTVRQGQGGSQSSRDGRSGGSHPKSAGASLRRYNEQALVQHVQDIVEQWRAEITKSCLIFYRAPGPYNRSVLFGGSNPVLERSDERLRTIPFSTRRATYTELKRVHSVLTNIQIFENMDAVVKQLDKHRLQNRDSKRNKVRTPQINRAKSRETVERPLPTKHSSELNLANSDSDEELDENILNSSDQEISFEHLKEFGSSEVPREKIKKKKPKKSKAKKLQEREQDRKNEIMKILNSGNVLIFKEFMENLPDDVEGNESKTNFLNEIIDDEANSLLHIAAINEHCELVVFLLENGADPALKNKKLQTPYASTTSKNIREAMKDFARENPDKYNYNKAQIPITTLTPEELAEKKRIQKKQKREKEKIKREQNKFKRLEESEKERFLKLSDREKRALAAERRIISQDGKVTSRCFVCASDMAGKVPFEYLGNRFCTMDCLKAHRLMNTAKLT